MSKYLKTYAALLQDIIEDNFLTKEELNVIYQSTLQIRHVIAKYE